MNKRIEELAMAAGLVYIRTPDKPFIDEDLEKFAELIVKECANVAADHDALDIYEEIREHFGVE